MSAYYNEIDPYAAQWLRNLIAAGEIAPGDVDERSIVDVKPDDLNGYTQCHFFAGIGGWSLAARLAGWPDERPLWTGSCPCQPFSVAGRGKGVADERHLWPHFYRLIRVSRPAVVMGEQVAGKAGYAWLDGVLADLEAETYTGRAVDIPACSVNAPQIRSRLYWVACADNARLEVGPRAAVQRGTVRHEGTAAIASGAGDGRLDSTPSARYSEGGLDSVAPVWDGTRRRESERRSGDGGSGRLGRASGSERREDAEGRQHVDDRTDTGWEEASGGSELASEATSGMGGTPLVGRREEYVDTGRRRSGDAAQRWPAGSDSIGTRGGFWDDWRLIGPDPDGKYRRIKSGITPLDTRLPGHVGQIRGYGNAICPELAAEVMRAWMETEAYEASRQG